MNSQTALLWIATALHLATSSIPSHAQNVSEKAGAVLVVWNPYFVQAKRDMKEALERLGKNRHFKKYHISESLLFALMEKESNFNAQAISSSGAVWYFWLKKAAEDDAKKFLHDTFWIRWKDYERNDAIDNIILWVSYYIMTRERVNTLGENIDIWWSEDVITLLAYNAGIWNVGKLVTIYQNETQKEEFVWEDFAQWITQKMWLSGIAQTKDDSEIYHITYQDWFDGNDFSQDGEEESIVLSSTLSLSKKKIQEMLNYVEKIAALQKRGTLVFQNPQVSEIIPQNTTQELFVQAQKGEWIYAFLRRNGFEWSLAAGTFLDINSSLFWGNILETETLPALKVWVKYQLPVMQFEIKTGETLDVILEKAKIHEKHRQKIIDFNTIFSPDFEKMTLGSPVYIPLWNTWFYTWNTQISEVPTLEKSTISEEKEIIPQGEFHFQTWIESIEIIGDSLKGKTFILDPGHGGPDLGAHPIVRDGKWDEISDPKSQIKVKQDENGNFEEGKTQRVATGTWNDFLHVYESLVVVDVSYRLAKMLREQWAEVYITRYNRTTGIIDSANMTTPNVEDDVYSDTWKWWEYSKNGQNERLKRGIKIGEDILMEWKSAHDIIFAAIHADNLATYENAPIVFKYYDGNDGISLKGKKFAEQLAENTHFRGQEAEADGQWLYVVNPRYNAIPNVVLIELGNMRNPATAYLLRQPGGQIDAEGNPIKGRQDYAAAIFEWFLKSVWNN